MLRIKLLRNSTLLAARGNKQGTAGLCCESTREVSKNERSEQASREYMRKALQHHNETNTEWDIPKSFEDEARDVKYIKYAIGKNFYTFIITEKCAEKEDTKSREPKSDSCDIIDGKLPKEPLNKNAEPTNKDTKIDREKNCPVTKESKAPISDAKNVLRDGETKKTVDTSKTDISKPIDETQKKLPSLSEVLSETATRLQKICIDSPTGTADFIVRSAAIPKLRSFKVTDIHRESMEELTRLAYLLAFTGANIHEHIPWFVSATAKGALFMNLETTCRMATILSHAGLNRDLAKLSSHILQNIPKFTCEEATGILLDFATSGLLASYPKMLEKLIPHCKFSYEQSVRLLYAIKHEKHLYKYVIPIVGPTAKDGKGATHAVNALCILQWENANSATEKQSETELIHAIGHMIRSVSTGLKIATPDMLRCLSTIAQAGQKYTLKPLKLLTAMSIKGEHINAASYEDNSLFLLSLLTGQCPELIPPVISSVKCRIRQDKLISAILQHFGKMKIRHQVVELCRLQNLPDIPKVKEGNVVVSSILSVVTKLIKLLGKADQLVKCESFPFIIRFYAETKNQNELLSLLKEIQTQSAAVKKELSAEERLSIVDPKLTSLRDHLIVCTRLAMKLSVTSTLSILCAEVVRDVVHFISLKGADDFLVWVLLKHADIGSFADEVIQDLAHNIEQHRTPEESSRLFRIVQAYPETTRVKTMPLFASALRKIPLEQFTRLPKLLTFAQEHDYYQIMEHRAAEFDFGFLLPYLMDRSTRMIPTHSLLHKLVDAAAQKPHSVTPRAFMETLLAYGRRNLYPEAFAAKYIEQFAYISSMFINDAVHAIFLLSRASGTKKTLHEILPQIAAKFIEWSSMKYLKAQEVSLICRALYTVAKWPEKKLAKQFCFDYFRNTEELRVEGDLQASYCFTVLSSQLDEEYDRLQSLITDYGKSESLAWCFETLAQNKVPSIIQACAKRCTLVDIMPRDLITILVHWKDVDDSIQGVTLEDVVVPVLRRCPNTHSRRRNSHMDSRTLNECINQLLKFGDISSRMRSAIICCFQRICDDSSDFGSVLYGLSKLDVDLNRYASTIVAVFDKHRDTLTAQQIGLVLNAFTKVEEIPKELRDLVVPRLKVILPKMNAVEFTQFAYPLLRFEALPSELGEVLANEVKSKHNLLSSSQAARLSHVLSKPYAPHDIRAQLHAVILTGTPLLKFQEVVGLLASDHTYYTQALVEKLRERLELLIRACSALDVNWAIRSLCRTSHKAVLQNSLKQYTACVPKLNNYEATVLLTSLLVSGTTEPVELIYALLDRIRECAGKELKGNNMLTLMNTVMRSTAKVHTYVGILMNILLEKCELNIAFLVQLADFCGRHSDNAEFNFSAVYERIVKEVTGILPVAPRSALSLLGTVQNVRNEYTLAFESLSNIATRLLPLEEMAPLITHNPALLATFRSRIDENMSTLCIPTLAAALSALQYKGQTAAESDVFGQTLMNAAAKLCAMEGESNAESPGSENSSSKQLNARAAVQLIHGYVGPHRPTLVAAITSRIHSPKELACVAPQLCLDAILRLAGDDVELPVRSALDPVIGGLLYRALFLLDSLPIMMLSKLLHAMYTLEVDDDLAVVKVFRRVQELKDMFLVHPELLKPILEIALYFGGNLMPRTTSMLQRLNEIPKIF